MFANRFQPAFGRAQEERREQLGHDPHEPIVAHPGGFYESLFLQVNLP
jgi:hypothetical protein